MTRLPLLLALAACTPVEWAEDPDDARIVTEDLPRFFEAVDAPGDLARNLDTLYLDAGSDGLDAMRRVRFRTAEALGRAYERDRAWYDAVRPDLVALHDDDAWTVAIRDGMAAAESEWPSARHPDVTLVVGDFGTGGTVTPEGLLVGAEFFVASDDAPLDTLDDWHRAVVRPPDAIPSIVSHEHAHAQQRAFCGNRGNTLLEQAINEGGADWLAERWSGSHANGHVHTWALPREALLWASFQDDMDGHAFGDWMYEGDRDDDQPADVGYFVGYRVTAAWWALHGEEPDAIERVLGAHCDAEAFLAESGYAP